MALAVHAIKLLIFHFQIARVYVGLVVDIVVISSLAQSLSIWTNLHLFICAAYC